jgi:hypothetical protein
MHWKDLQTRDGRWAGLELAVAKGERPPKPKWRLEYAAPGRVRAVCGRRVQLWARLDEWWEDWWVVLGERVPEGVLPPIRSEVLRQVRAAPGSDTWWSAWARRYARWLHESAHSPLYPARWWLTSILPGITPQEDRTSFLTPHAWYAVKPERGVESFERLFSHAAQPLRAPSPEDDPRVKAWRKRARDGSLPPLLLLWSANLGLFFLLDGHDRLRAAQLEQKPVAAFALWPVETQRNPPDLKRQEAVWRAFEEILADPERRQRVPTSTFNATLLDVYGTEYLRSPQRVWPLPQGRIRWAREVRRRLTALGVDPDTSDILRPLTHLPSGRPRRRRPPAPSTSS